MNRHRRALLAAALSGPLLALAEEGERRPPFITTPLEVVDRMLTLAGARATDTVMDLGSGDGRIVIRAAEKFGARGVGIELDAALVEKSRENARAARVAERVSFVHGDVLAADLSGATVVTVYLLPGLLDRLQPRFVSELKPGTRVVSHAFGMPGWKPDRSELIRISGRHAGQGDESTLLLWIVPAEARGLWRGGDWELRVFQNYQEIDLEAKRGGRPIEVREATLRGSEIGFRTEQGTFAGRIEGGRIAGRLTRGGSDAPLELVRVRAR